MEFIKNGSINKFTTFITTELDSQDKMHRYLEKEKNLKI